MAVNPGWEPGRRLWEWGATATLVTMLRILALGVACFLPLLAAAEAAEPAAVTAQAMAILEAKCWRCHGSDKGRGGLRLHTAEDLAKGGEHGPVVIAGKPDESPLVAAIKRGDPDTAMPPKDAEALSPDEIAALVAWVQAGAAWPQ